MAVTLRSVTVGTNTGSTATVSATTPGTAQVGDVVLVCHSNDFYTVSTMPTPTATGSPTLTSVTTADGGSNGSHIKAYTYVANTAGAQTVSVTETGTHDEEKAMVVMVFGGVDTTTPVDASANASGAISTAHIAPSVSPASSNAYLVIVLGTGGGAAVTDYTTPAPLTEQQEYHIPSVGTVGLSGVIATNQLSASGATGTFQFVTNGPAWGAVTIALKTAAGGTTHSASASGTATSSGAAAVVLVLAGSASGSATSTGTAAAVLLLAASATGSAVSTGSAAATVVPPGPVTHQATASGTTTSSGTAAVAMRLAVSATGISLFAGSAAVALLLAVAASGTSTSAGSAAATIPGSVIERPNTGTVTRPDSGVITRPFTGTVSRP